MVVARPTINARFITVDSLRIRIAEHEQTGRTPLLLLSPWPESIYAYWQMWDLFGSNFSAVAVDLPGFGQSEGRAELMAPETMGEFVVEIAAALGLERPHAVGPDIGTSTLLFAAARHPDAFASIQIGGGATAFPLQATGLLKQFIEAPDLDQFRAADSAQLIAGAVKSIPGYAAPDEVVEDYVESYSGTRFVESIEFVRSYPAQLQRLGGLLPTLDTPVHVLTARDDPYTPVSDHEQLATSLPHAKLTVLPNGHNAWEESPSSYAELLTQWAGGGYLEV
jgi:pimeloyl-ACP methyl ester carboxylesterase